MKALLLLFSLLFVGGVKSDQQEPNADIVTVIKHLSEKITNLENKVNNNSGGGTIICFFFNYGNCLGILLGPKFLSVVQLSKRRPGEDDVLGRRI